MFKYKGYAGSYLRVNLSKRKIEKLPLPKGLAKYYLGGTGFCARILWNEVSPQTDPLEPKNRLVFAVGPVTGTFFPPAGRYVIASKSPLTGIWAESHAGGHFGAELKYAGYDMIVVQGRSEKPVYLYIDDDHPELRNADHLWGKDTRETTKIIREDARDETLKVACIGVAGENLVRYACIISDFYRAAGRAGMGTVMGSKNLKAIAVRGTKGVEVANPEEFLQIADKAYSMCTTGKWGKAGQASLGKYGTPNLVPAMNAIGRQPTKNHWTGVYEFVEDIGPEALRNYRVSRDSCFTCGIQCKFMSHISVGPYKGTLTSGPEYETLTSFGSNCLNNNLESIIYANLLCNLYGLDTISTGKAISFAMECYEHQILRKEDVDGLDMSWGNEESIITLIHKIAKREGVGNLLAEGVKRAAQSVGKGAEKYAIHGKGLEASSQDGRAHKSIGLTFAISVRGADHLRSLCTIDELGYVCDLLSEKKKGMIVKDQEDFFAIVDSLIICKYGAMWPPIYYFDFISKLLPPLTGMKEYENVNVLRETAERICNLRRCFNVREGQTRKDEQMHPRFTQEPMPHGPAKGHVVKLDPMLDEYYELRGWDKETGLPLRSTLEKLGLHDVAEELAKQEKVKP